MPTVLSIQCPICKKDLPMLRSKTNRDYFSCEHCTIFLKNKARDFYQNLNKINVSDEDES